MTTAENKEFFKLIASISEEQTFAITLTDKKEYIFKQINTHQLKELVKTVVDSPLTQSMFNTTVSKIFKQNIITPSSFDAFNIIDRMIFIIEMRVASISSTITQQETSEKEAMIDLNAVLIKLRELLDKSSFLFENQTLTEEKISITYGIPLIDTDDKLNKEVYKDIKPDVENTDELRKLIGEAFVNEITKTVKVISIGDAEFDLSNVDFKTRVQMVESLPANLIKQIISFVEKYKQVIDTSLQVTKDLSLSVDGSLFSLK